MTWKRWAPALFILSSCAHLGAAPSESWQRARLWNEAHGYFATGDFERADSVFSLISVTYPETNEGREALFYLGVLSLDPRNPDWDAAPAEAHLQRYLLADSGVSDTEGMIHRRPEGETLYRLARQFDLPSEERIEPLRSPVGRTTVVVREAKPSTLGAEIEQLRLQVANRDEQIRTLREELDRIRKTLTGGQ